CVFLYFIFRVTAPPEIYTLSLHDALPICGRNDTSGVGTGENVLVSCIIIATTIFRLAMWSVLSPRVPAAAAPQSYTRAARLHRRSEEHTSELQSRSDLVCRLLLEKKNTKR